MAKFAVLFLAALAFQAAFAGVHSHLVYKENTLGDYEYGLKAYGTGDLDNLFDKFQSVTHDLTVYFQKALPNDRLVIRTITYQSHELAQYIDMVIYKLQLEANNYSGEVNIVLQQIISEFREIQTGFLQVAHYTEVYGVSQLKNQFYTYFQNTIVQIEKLMRLVQTDFEHTQGEFHMIVKNVIADFLYVFQNIYTHVQYFGVYGEQTTPRQLAMQIEEVTKSLTGYLHGLDYSQIQQFRYALHEYVQHVEVIIYRLQALEGTMGHLEIDTVFQQICSKLRRVLVPLMQFIEAEHIENFEFVRSQLIKEFLFVAEEFEQLVQYVQTGSQQTFIYEVLGDYLYALHQFRHHMQSGYHGGYYGLYQGGFYGKTGYQDLYKYGGYGKYGQGYGFGKYGQQYVQGYGFGKYGQQYGQGYEFGKYGQQYGQGYGFGKYGQQYGQGYGFGKYGQQYGQRYGFGKYGQQYGQGYGFGKYGQQYGQGYGFGKYGQQYGQGYGFGKYGQQYGQGYGFGKYGQHYGQGYGLGKYGQEYEHHGLEQYGKGYGYGYQNTNGYQYTPFGKYFQTYQTAIHAY